MTTSALALQQLLTVASTAENQQERFLSFLAKYLGIEGVGAEGQVASILLKQLAEIEADIENLPIEEKMKVHLTRMVRPFLPIKNLSQMHLDIKNAKANFLKAENLVGLMNIHLALNGHSNRPELPRAETQTLAKKFRDIAAEIQAEDLPESLKNSFLRRTLKMASILDHYYAFGPEELQAELEGLVGSMVVSPPTESTSIVSLYKNLSALVVTGFVILGAVDKSLASVLSISDNANKLIELVDDKPK